jgi:hypothetical protein
MTPTTDNKIAQDNDVAYPPLPDTPPGMIGDDIPLYRAWLKNPKPTPHHVYFNVRVGPRIDELIGAAGDDLRTRAQIYAPRIDLLLWDSTSWWIIEFHGNAGLAQLGRLEAYPDLFRATYRPPDRVQTLLVAQSINPFIPDLFIDRNIAVILFPDLTQPPTVIL